MLYSFIPHSHGRLSYFVQAPNKQLAIRSVINWSKENQSSSCYDLGSPSRSVGAMLRDLKKNYDIGEAAQLQVVTNNND